MSLETCPFLLGHPFWHITVLNIFLWFFVFLWYQLLFLLFYVFFLISKNSFFLIYLFVYFWLCWVFIAVHGLSLVVVSGAYSSLWCSGFSLQWLLLLQSTDSRHVGFSSCGTQAQYLWHMGLVAPWHVGSSQTRAQTHVLSIGWRILNHCATREVPLF